MTPEEQRVLELIDEDALISLTSDLISASSENPGGTEAATVEVLRTACENHGLQTEVSETAPGRPNLVATLPGGTGHPGSTGTANTTRTGANTADSSPAPIMFLGHSDVVPAGSGWTRDPFIPVLQDGRLYGRGATDMKGGLAAVVVAMGALAKAGVALPAPVQLVCAVDEEEHGLGIRAFTRELTETHKNAAPAAAPADTPPDTPAYSACIVAEPTDLETVIGCRGDSYFELTVTGIAAHSGNPSDGRNAIDAASKVLELIRRDGVRLAASPDPLLGHGTWNVGQIEGGHGTSIVAASCTVSLDRRLMPDEDPEQLAAALREQIRQAGIDTDGIDIQLEVLMEMPGFRTSADSPVAAAAVEAIADAGGGRSPVGGWTAACDGGFIARDFGVDTIVLGPGGLNDEAHQPDESVSVAEMKTAAGAYGLMCLRILSGQPGGFRSLPQTNVR